MASKYAIETIFKAVDNITAPIRKMDAQMGKFGATGNAVNNALKKGFADAEKSLGKITTGLKNAVVGLQAAGVAAAGAFAVNGVKNAIEYEQSLAKLSTVAGDLNMDKAAKDILAVSTATHTAATEITDATYDAITKGIDAANAVDFVATATKTAKASFTDTTTAIDGLTSVLNAYGYGAEKANKIADQMLVTQNLGNTSFADMTSAMGQVAPLAATLGVETDDLFASITALTAAGFKTPQAMKGMKTALQSVLKPSAEAQKIANQLGIDFSEAAIKSKGWVGFLDDVAQKTGGDTELLSKLFGNNSGFNVLLTNGAGKLTDALDAMRNSTGAAEDALNKMMKTPQERIAGLKNQFQNAGIKLGQALLPVFEKVADKVEILVNKIDSIDFDKVAASVGKAMGFVTGLIETVWALRVPIVAITAAVMTFKGVMIAIVAVTKGWTAVTAVAKGAQLAYAIAVKGSQAAMLALGTETKAVQIATEIFSVAMKGVGWVKATAGIIGHKVATLAMAGAQGVATAATGALSTATGILNALFVASPIGWIVLAIGALIAIIILCVKHWDKITAAVSFAWEKLKQFASFIWDKLCAAFTALGEMMKKAAEIIKGVFLSAIDAVWQPIQRIIDAFTNGGIIAGIKQIGATILKFMLTPILTIMGTLAKIPVIGDKIGEAKEWIEGKIDSLAYIQDDEESKPATAPTSQAFTPYAAAQVNTQHTEVNRSEMQISLDKGLNVQVNGKAPGITVQTQKTGTF